MEDRLVSLKAAIDAFYIQADDDGWWTGTVQDMEELLKGLPSAQPEIVRCKECKWCDMGECEHKLGLIVANDENYCSYAERRSKD